jgi:hypothetical protein
MKFKLQTKCERTQKYRKRETGGGTFILKNLNGLIIINPHLKKIVQKIIYFLYSKGSTQTFTHNQKLYPIITLLSISS